MSTPRRSQAYLHGRDATRREHQLELQRDFGFRSFSATIYRELAGWLLSIALSTDVGPVLVGALVDELRERKVLAPALSTIERLAWETGRRAERLVFVRLIAGLTNTQRGQLDTLLVVAPGARMTTLAALRQPPRRPTPATFVALAERLQTIRAIGLNADVARQVHPTRLVRLAREGARYWRLWSCASWPRTPVRTGWPGVYARSVVSTGRCSRWIGYRAPNCAVA